MRILMLHCDYFKSEMTEKTRSPLREETVSPVVEAENCLVVLAAVEKIDETDPTTTVGAASDEIKKLARELNVERIILHSFAHLFTKLATPHVALNVLQSIQTNLSKDSLTVLRTPFGWFNTLEVKAKGHPLSRVARQV